MLLKTTHAHKICNLCAWKLSLKLSLLLCKLSCRVHCDLLSCRSAPERLHIPTRLQFLCLKAKEFTVICCSVEAPLGDFTFPSVCNSCALKPRAHCLMFSCRSAPGRCMPSLQSRASPSRWRFWQTAARAAACTASLSSESLAYNRL